MRAAKRVEYTKKLLYEIGMGSVRLEFFHIAASGAPLIAETAKEMTERAKKLGPNPYRAKLQQKSKKDKE